jgi:OmpA family protein
MEGIKHMRGRKLIAVAFAASLWVGGYASYAYGWEPVIDHRMDSAAATQDRDLAECRELASRASGDTMTEVAKGTVMGALGGAAFGAMIGGISGHAGTGAAYGAAIGGTGGALHNGLSAEEQYKHSYIRCLEGRGHRVLNY